MLQYVTDDCGVYYLVTVFAGAGEATMPDRNPKRTRRFLGRAQEHLGYLTPLEYYYAVETKKGMCTRCTELVQKIAFRLNLL